MFGMVPTWRHHLQVNPLQIILTPRPAHGVLEQAAAKALLAETPVDAHAQDAAMAGLRVRIAPEIDVADNLPIFSLCHPRATPRGRLERHPQRVVERLRLFAWQLGCSARQWLEVPALARSVVRKVVAQVRSKLREADGQQRLDGNHGMFLGVNCGTPSAE